MSSVNKVILVGRLGADPESRQFDNGMITNISVATSEKIKDKQTNELKEVTEWHRVALFGKLAEIAGQYLKKGSQVYIEGKIRTRKYTDKTTGMDKYSTEITADAMQMLGSKADANNHVGGADFYRPAAQQAAPRPVATPADRSAIGGALLDDIPF